jgi:peptidoglycan/LPS O-acetylase OafA/YrhL
VFGPKNYWHLFLNLRLINFIGLLSYSLYLWQQIFTNNTKYWVTSFPYNLLLMGTMTFFSYYAIEKPFLRIKDRFYN